MNYDLGQLLYCVNDDYYVVSGRVRSIETTSYKHRKHYAQEGKTEFNTYKKYSLDNGSGWYYSDKCFLCRSDAVLHAKRLLETKLQRINDQLNYVVKGAL